MDGQISLCNLMSLAYSPHYQELCQQMNPYLAVLQIAKESRIISMSLDNRIPSATALDYASINQLPNPKDYPDHRLDRVKNYISYIDDVEVTSSIISSYEQSLQKNNLVYDYTNVDDEPRQARIRIIINILWDNRPHKEI